MTKLNEWGLGAEVGNETSLAINSLSDWDNFVKADAAVSSYQTEHAGMTGYSALRVESLEPQLRLVVARKESFTLWNMLKRQPVTSAVHEWMNQTSLGGQNDGMNISETGTISFDVGEYNRFVERVKLFATGAQVSLFLDVQKLHGQQAVQRENANGLTRMANAVERSLWVADERYNPNKINGLYAQIGKFDGGSHILDFKGTNDVNELIGVIMECKADVRQEGNFGDISHIFTDSYLQTAIDKSLFPQFRVHLDNNPASIQMGAPVAGIKTSTGNIKIAETIWNNNNSNTVPTIVKTKGVLPKDPPPTPTVTVAPLAAPQPGGAEGWTAERAGEYYYFVSLTDANGVEGPLSVIASATVAAGGAIKISGTVPESAVKATAAKLYRSRRNPATAPTPKDVRFLGETVVEAGAFTYIDVNQNIPGASSVPVLNMDPEAIQWLQLRPATQFPLFPTNTLMKPWAIALFGTLMLGQPQHHYWIKNVLYDDMRWHPFK